MQLDSFFGANGDAERPGLDLRACAAARERGGDNAAIILSDARRGQAYGNAAAAEHLIHVGIAVWAWNREIRRMLFVVAGRLGVEASDEGADGLGIFLDDAVQGDVASTEIMKWLIRHGLERAAEQLVAQERAFLAIARDDPGVARDDRDGLRHLAAEHRDVRLARLGQNERATHHRATG